MRALEAALNEVWAMEENALATLLSIAAREHELPTPEALEAYRAKTADNAERATMRDGIGILAARGPMFKYANLFTAISGATSYESMHRDLQALVDQKPKAIILNLDTPGGQANGVGEFAQAVHDLRGKIPIVAYVGGMGASAGYWIASAADKIVVDPTAMLGSIGAQMAITVDGEPKGGAKTYKFISSVSPLKNADPGTEEGAKGLQGVVDALGKVFVETVARNRGVATETVLKDFGKGGIFVGKDAVKAGLADEIGSFESVFAGLVVSARKPSRNKGISMTVETDTTATQPAASAPTVDVAAEVQRAVAASLTAERARTAGLTKIAKAHGVSDETLTAALAEGKTVEAFALEVADAAAKSGEKKVAALKTDEEAAAQAAASNGTERDTESADAIAARIAAA